MRSDSSAWDLAGPRLCFGIGKDRHPFGLLLLLRKLVPGSGHFDQQRTVLDRGRFGQLQAFLDEPPILRGFGHTLPPLQATGRVGRHVMVL